jgi:integrase/recombinase XerD
MLEKYTVKKIRVEPREEKLPIILTKDEIRRIIDAASNLKEKLIVQFMYSCGLRVSEATNMKLEDLDFFDMTGTIRKGKGKKDRRLFLSNTVVQTIQEYIKTKKFPSLFVFSKSNGLPYTTRSFQLTIKKLAEKAKITKEVHSHMFRHAFGTHLVEDGYDIVRVQGMMGHSSLETTKLYVTLSKEQFKGITNPLDKLYEENG